ncbi:hypothetical protein SAMN05660359_04386 [Geodermatophilus obscurus]|uniref:Uncharacterized protein n=1 Tax=Geodermatophilus obscurus TaxID=1861 RepID=A0A1I5I803_9ACTN|nr:hypothetical protein [Geodermatophilus obscurus]SFO56657.1 hypothetical protein SAMN05660359_04386 [Geodermatophilus obscurus]
MALPLVRPRAAAPPSTDPPRACERWGAGGSSHLLAGVIGATTGEATLLVQARAQLGAGLATLLQTVGIGPAGCR